MKFVGIQLKAGSPITKTRYLFSGFGCLIIMSNILINGMKTIHNFDSIRYFKLIDAEEHWKRNGLVESFHLLVDALSFIVTPLTHLIFILIILWTPRWDNLLNVLEKISKTFYLDKNFYRTCRKKCIFLLFAIALVNITYI